MATIYNWKHVVFEQVGLDSNELQWNSISNVDGDNAYNDWNISRMRNTHLPAKLLLLSNDLQSILTNTTIQTATNGNNGVLVSTSDKLFLAAEKEMTGTRINSVSQEFNALTTRTYRTTHTTDNDRIKKDPTNTDRSYWLRSPVSGVTGGAVYANNVGGLGGANVNGYAYRVSLCYAL